MFLVFIPTPYVDASSAWSFRNKWHRIFVGAAGMIVELFFAGICAFIWMNTGDPNSLVAQLAFNAMLVASFTTIVFNANPLLRYDGYYILSDFLEIPNLRQKSTEYTMGLLKRHVFGVKLQQPLPPPLQRFWLLIYAITSSIYRTFVGVVIILLVAFQIPILGILMAIGGVITWLTVPAFKIFKYLAIDPELHRKRTRATIFTLAVTAAVVILIGFIPFNMDVDEVAVADAQYHESVTPQMEGFVKSIPVQDQSWVKKGDVILIAVNPELNKDIDRAGSEVKSAERELAKARVERQTDPTIQIETFIKTLQVEVTKLETLEEKRKKLTIRAEIDGILVAPKLNELEGRYLTRGKMIAKIVDPSRLTIRVLLEQKEVGVLTRQSPFNPTGDVAKLTTEIRLISDVGTVINGGPALLKPAADKDSPGPGATQQGGEEAQVDPQNPEKLATDEFQVEVPIDNLSGKSGPTLTDRFKYVPGQKAWVRFKLGKEPLYWQWYRKLLQLLQSKQAHPLV